MIDESIRTYRKALEAFPESAPLSFSLGRAYGAAHPRRSLYHQTIRNAGLFGDVVKRQEDTEIFSNYGEQEIISRITSSIPGTRNFCVDIGASNGITHSNTYNLFRNGWDGVAIEGRSDNTAILAYVLQDVTGNVRLVKAFAKPGTIVPLLQSLETPRDIGFLNLDIDSFDYDILNEVLKSFRPTLVCMEINERVPPPIEYALHYNESFKPNYGMLIGASISSFEKLLDRHGYGIVQLEYNNLFAVPREILETTKDWLLEISVEKAWNDGYYKKGDRLVKCPWINEQFEQIYSAPTREAVELVASIIAPYASMCTLKA